ncbi:MAG: hypothetical protein HC819_07310 [Cyclobacteriaceae bacterium]|nr:hypothetical protein [Cyclobacteriaceae bacterium]
MNSDELRQVKALLVQDLRLANAIENPNLEDLQNWLAKEIARLMDSDFQAFLNLLYRIDINEEKSRQAFAEHDPPGQFARLIIERELQKVVTRIKYTQ